MPLRWPRGISPRGAGSELRTSPGQFLPCLSFPIHSEVRAQGMWYRAVRGEPGDDRHLLAGNHRRTSPRPQALWHLDLQVLILIGVAGAVPGVVGAEAGAAHLAEERGALLPPQPAKESCWKRAAPIPPSLWDPIPGAVPLSPSAFSPWNAPTPSLSTAGGGSAPALLALCSLHIKIHQQRLMGKIGNGGPGMVGMQLSHPSRLVPCALLESMNYLGRACGEAAGAGRGEDEASIIPL